MAKNNSNSNNAPTPAQEKKGTISEALKAIGKRALERNPNLSAVYITSDGYLFGTNNDAENHAKKLKNQNVTTIEKTIINE